MGKRRAGHRQSLGDQLENPQLHGVRVYPHKKKMRKSGAQDLDTEEVDAVQSSKILALAKDQQQEVNRENAQESSFEGAGVACSFSDCTFAANPARHRYCHVQLIWPSVTIGRVLQAR